MSTRSFALAFATAVLLLLTEGDGCGGTSGDKEAGEACTRSKECVDDLVCTGGMCQLADAGATDT